MKKLFAILLALAMVFSLSVTALAVEGDDNTSTTGKITITNATKGAEYKLYKIFDASYNAEKGVAYTIAPTIEGENGTQIPNPVHAALFGDEGEEPNPYFEHAHGSGSVWKAKDATDSQIIAYLQEVIKGFVPEQTVTEGTEGMQPGKVVFSNVPHGYYLIVGSTGTAVTICSNTPNADVIDKNQMPGGMEKKVLIGQNAQNEDDYGTFNTAAIGDRVSYKLIAPSVTNYEKIDKIKAYQFVDSLGAGLWADFSSVKVTVGENELNRGWLLNQATNDSRNYVEGRIGTWDGDWTKAQFYVVYEGNNKFRITIPWITGYEPEKANGIYNLKVNMENESLYDSPTSIVVTYDALVGANAVVGVREETNLKNVAQLRYLMEGRTHITAESVVKTETYGIGILKRDAATPSKVLAGAKFRLYAENGTTPVALVPTNVEGVYMVDSKDTDAAKFNGLVDTARELASEKLAAYENPEIDKLKQHNYGITPVNGKMVILGLDAGTYTLLEVEAPDGYNPMKDPIKVTVGGENYTPERVYVNTDTTGKAIAELDAGQGHIQHEYSVTNVLVDNSQGDQLPATGGETAMKLITFGSILAIGFAVLLITQKKMSIYKD